MVVAAASVCFMTRFVCCCLVRRNVPTYHHHHHHRHLIITILTISIIIIIIFTVIIITFIVIVIVIIIIFIIAMSMRRSRSELSHRPWCLSWHLLVWSKFWELMSWLYCARPHVMVQTPSCYTTGRGGTRTPTRALLASPGRWG